MGFLRKIFGGGEDRDPEMDRIMEKVDRNAFPGGESDRAEYAKAVYEAVRGKLTMDECMSITVRSRVLLLMKRSRAGSQPEKEIATSISVSHPSLAENEIEAILVALGIAPT